MQRVYRRIFAHMMEFRSGVIASVLLAMLSSLFVTLQPWPIKFVIPAGFVMLALQGVSEAIKRVAALQGYVVIDAKYERPTQ